MGSYIVVINNDDNMRDMFALCLKTAAYRISSYTYAHINLAELEANPPDLIVLDFSFGDAGIGWEFLQLLKMDDTTVRIPILVTTTAFQLPLELQGYLLSQYISVVSNPFDLDNFLMLVQKTLALADQADQIFFGGLTLPVLLVEDTDELRDIIATVLTLEGYLVGTAYNGLVALESVSRADYSLILLDIAMPIMNGYEFLSAYNRQLRPHSPVIILSGELDIQTHILPAFVVNVLPKPFELSHLLRLVGKYAQPV